MDLAGDLGGSWGGLDGSWGVLGLSWGGPVGVLGWSWGVLGGSLGVLEGSWRGPCIVLGGSLRGLREGLGGSLGVLGTSPGPSDPLSWGISGGSWLELGQCWVLHFLHGKGCPALAQLPRAVAEGF